MLTIRVTHYRNTLPPKELTCTVNSQGLTIGRGPDNDLVLADPERIVSHRHASVRFDGENYMLADDSTNGVFVNHSEKAVGRGHEAKLSNGDILSIGKYECAVAIETAVQLEQQPAADHSSAHNVAQADVQNDNWAKEPEPIPSLFRDSGAPAAQAPNKIPEDFDNFFNQSSTPAASPSQPNTAPEAPKSAENEHFTPPQMIPEDWDLGLPEAKETPAQEAPAEEPQQKQAQPFHKVDLFKEEPKKDEASAAQPDSTAQPKPKDIPPLFREDVPTNAVPPQPSQHQAPPPASSPEPQPQVTPEPAPRQQPSAAQAQANDAAFHAFLKGLGIQAQDIPTEQLPQFMEEAGQLLRAMTHGYKAILDTRANVKGEFRLGMTLIRPVENNPLKFSIDVEDAVTKLVFPPPRGYMKPVEAVQEASEDLQAHQVAVLAGLRAALKTLVARFDPEALEQTFQERSLLNNLIPGSRKGRCWDAFKIAYSQVAADAENDFMYLLGDEFAEAYERQIVKLKNARPR